jgi:hypothetical protein
MARFIVADGGYDGVMHRFTRLIFLAVLMFSICLLSLKARSDTSATAPAERSTLAAAVKVTLDPRAAADYGVDPHQVDAAVADFEAQHDAFTLTDLQNIKIPAGPDKSLLLSEIATVDVQFSHLAGK